ncbi:helix-turn-helix transcriptional regulator [Tepidanaerobacter sp. EBM-49]|uniref:helix-turn-helix transcriptional regulator n=1 Tax=Tepidanaerobacter sp. EBM-49 TaxID=1918504 RepID=UPI001BD4BBA5|nr:helix-turn-helix transcriptional regulator [Tepidanaerobacter syntrophicus]
MIRLINVKLNITIKSGGGDKVLKIKDAREAARLTQKELAEKVDVSREYISAIENGHYNPSLNLLKKIAKALNTNIKDLIEEESA